MAKVHDEWKVLPHQEIEKLWHRRSGHTGRGGAGGTEIWLGSEPE